MIKKSFIFCLLAILFGCSEEKETPKEIKWTNESSIELNKSLAEEEEINIKLYLAQRPNWKMTKTGSGLQYFVYENGQGAVPTKDQIVQVEYQISLLDGTICYQTAKDEFNEFKVDKSDIESGVQEAIKLLKKGDKAKLIIPSHIAHGLVGDLDKIPPMSTLIVDIKILDIK